MSSSAERSPGASRLWTLGLAAAAALAALSLWGGLGGGLVRLGWSVPGAAWQHHGAVMCGGVFGTLITLERALALRRPWGLLAPWAAGLGGVLAVAGAPTALPASLFLLAAAVLVALYVHAGRSRAWSLPLRVELTAALCWAAGSAAWAHHDLDAARSGWMGFLVLTIAAERRELTQLLRLPQAVQRAFVAVVALMALAVAHATLAAWGLGLVPARGQEALWWLACGLLAVGLLRWDLAPRQWRASGWIGHTAQCLTVGYAWLLGAALLGLAGAGLGAGPLSAQAPHALWLGFVLPMVLGHAPIILPALLRVRPVYLAAVRLPLWLLSASLLLRGAAAVSGEPRWWAAAGLGHVLALALFAVLMVTAARRGARR